MLFENTIKRDSSLNKQDGIQEAYEKMFEAKVEHRPLKSPKKPFSYKGKWYTRDEMKKMGLDKEASKAILKEDSINERKFDLGSGTMGNGIVVWNKAKEVHGDYEKVAHIDSNRKVKYYIKNPPKQVKDYVEKIAKGKNPAVSRCYSSINLLV